MHTGGACWFGSYTAGALADTSPTAAAYSLSSAGVRSFGAEILPPPAAAAGGPPFAPFPLPASFGGILLPARLSAPSNGSPLERLTNEIPEQIKKNLRASQVEEAWLKWSATQQRLQRP